MAPFRCFALGLCAASLLMIQSALAITAEDVMQKMTEKERVGYLTGLVDMLAYQSLLAGNTDRAKCISDAFYKKPNESTRSIFGAFAKYPDKAPEGLIVVLMKQACPP